MSYAGRAAHLRRLSVLRVIFFDILSGGFWHVRSNLQNLIVVFISTCISILLVEFICWGWVNIVRENHLPRWEYRATQPPAYKNAGYFGKTFLRESENAVTGRLSDVAELDDFTGQYINVRDGFRVTTDVPDNVSNRVLLFGGSTLFGQEVPDSETIASYLQRRLTSEGRHLQVMNYGLPGMDSYQQLRILQRVPVVPGDIVIFYHGVNDIFYVVFGGAQTGWTAGVPIFRPVQKLDVFAKWMNEWHKRLKPYSYTADVALDVYDRSVPRTVTDRGELSLSVNIAGERFAESIERAHRYTVASGAKFLHFLQPTIYDVDEKSDYEESLLRNYLQTPPGVDVAFDIGYPKLRKVSLTLQDKGIQFYDITDSLNSHQDLGEIFLDFCHINHIGNKIIADRIFQEYFTNDIGVD